MGVICCRNEPPGMVKGSDALPETEWGKEVAESESILKLQEVELETQDLKCGKLADEIAKLQERVRGADHVLLTNSEKQFTLKAIFELEEQNRELVKVFQSLVKSREDCASAKRSVAELTEALKQPPDSLPGDLEAFKRSLTTLHNDLAHSHKSVKGVEDKLALLRQQHEEEETIRLQLLQARSNKLERILRVPSRWIGNALHRSWTILATKPEIKIEIPEVQSEGESPKDLSPEKWTPVEIGEVDVLLKAEFDLLKIQSPFSQIAPSVRLPDETFSKMIIEAMVARSKDPSPTLSFPRFFIDFLSYTYPDIPPSSIPATISSLQSELKSLSLISSSLLNWGESAPYSNEWASKVSAFFKVAYEWLVKQSRLKGEEPKVTLNSKVFLSELLNCTYEQFAGAPGSGERMIKALKPDHITQGDYALFVLSHKMKQKSIENLGLFKRVDIAGKGKIRLDQFVPGVRDVLGVWLSPDSLLSLVKDLAKGAGEVSRVDFLRLNFKTYLGNAGSEMYATTLAKVLQAAYEAYVEEMKMVTAALRESVGVESTMLSDVEFFAKTRSLSNDINDTQLSALWAELTELRRTGVSAGDAAVRVMLRHAVHPRC